MANHISFYLTSKEIPSTIKQMVFGANKKVREDKRV